MLWEEFEVFAKNDTDIGNVNHKKLKIGIKYNIPYQAASNSISRPVYQELNYYLCPRSTEYTLDYQQSSRVLILSCSSDGNGWDITIMLWLQNV